MNVDLLIKENQELNEEKQRYKEMWFNANNSLAKYRKLEEQLGCPLEVRDKALKQEVIYYEEKGKLIEVIAMTCGWDRYRNTKICTFNCLCESNYRTRVLRIKTSDYKKTWWLREDKSE